MFKTMAYLRSWRLDAVAVSLFIFTAAFLFLMLGSKPGNAEKPTPAMIARETPAPAKQFAQNAPKEVSLDSQIRILAIINGE